MSSAPRLYRSLIIIAALMPTGISIAQAPIRTDSFGDALPQGVLARLGTLRLLHMGWISATAISPDGTTAASGVRSGTEGKIICTVPVLRSSDGAIKLDVHFRIATIRCWDVKSGKLLREIATPDSPVTALRFDSSSRVLYAASGEYLVAWEVTTGAKLWEKEIPRKEDQPRLGVGKIHLNGTKLIALLADESDNSLRHSQGKEAANIAVRFLDADTGELGTQGFGRSDPRRPGDRLQARP